MPERTRTKARERMPKDIEVDDAAPFLLLVVAAVSLAIVPPDDVISVDLVVVPEGSATEPVADPEVSVETAVPGNKWAMEEEVIGAVMEDIEVEEDEPVADADEGEIEDPVPVDAAAAETAAEEEDEVDEVVEPPFTPKPTRSLSKSKTA
jgi:hypothetical protein